MNPPVVEVAVCVVQTSDGRVLLAERTARQVAAGFWELPGGKIEPGETPVQAAARELQEETGLAPVGIRPWLSYEHQFPTKLLRLHLFRTREWQGSPHGREGQRLAWVDPRAPHVGPILESNDRALAAINLPQAYMLADFRPNEHPYDFLRAVRDALSSGATLLRVRTTGISPGQATSLLARVAGLAGAFPAASILVSSITQARRAGLAGVHSNASALRQLTARPPARLWAATCHDNVDLARAISLGADFVVLSPIKFDPESPGQPPIGWEGLRRSAAASPVGIYAHGGLTPADAQAAQLGGAAGLVVACAPLARPRQQANRAMATSHEANMRF
jgi:8-oxo-dGTP diphosphatase